MKRIISVILCLLTVLSLIPLTAAAQGGEPDTPPVQLQYNVDDADEDFNYFQNLGHALMNFGLYTLGSPAVMIALMVVTGPAAPVLVLGLMGVSIADLGKAIIGMPTTL